MNKIAMYEVSSDGGYSWSLKQLTETQAENYRKAGFLVHAATLYIAYYYDYERNLMPGFDSNELSVNGKFLSMITSVRTSYRLSELQPTTETEQIILITPIDTKLNVDNYNPCPEDLDL